MKKGILRYSEVVQLPTFEDRFEYLKLKGKVGTETFGFDRYLNQVLYHSSEWRSFRNRVITRDEGCDLAFYDRPIGGRIYIHHLNPITLEDVENRDSNIFDMENVICVSHETHNAIHYGDANLLIPSKPTTRVKNDTCPWKQHI